ncbi:MAG: hypothetical protein MSH11_02950 [Ruminococcus sp.]|nr:hypothetical protein [Ruminococcus sp.]
MKHNPYEELANAIILQAVKEYKLSLKALRRYPHDSSASYRKREVEQFFRSKWFKELTDADAEFIINGLKEDYLYDGKRVSVTGKVS